MIERYSRKEIADIWSLSNKYRIWLDIEIAACEANADEGIIPLDDLKIIKEKADFDVDRINQIESEVHHDVIAFLTSVNEHVGESGRYIHYGMTSSDIGDTALCIQMKQAGEILIKDIEQLIEALRLKSLEYKNIPCMGRSHGVHAEPTTFGMKMLLYYKAFERSLERMKRAVENVSYGKLSGAVGTFSNISYEVERKVCEKMGLKADEVSTQVIQRDRHAEYMSAIAITAASLDQLATEIRHLQRTEVREAEEPFQKGQKGSSAMPHKRNPILCERITGLSRVIKSNLMTALEDVTLWHERDISHSSAERVILPDSTVTLDYLLHKMIFIISNLHIYPENMTANINRTGGLFYSQRVLLKLIEKGMSREDAYKTVQTASMETWAGKGSLMDTLKATEAGKLISDSEFSELFDINYYLRNIDSVYKKCGLK
ncbi:MAG TPA: adenylosuccinate lyase [Spirochaetota bacterium]|jgi:adenylosuccinate lyase|nr:adenylosuccinate lyase [Spirochaetota bacterium]HOH37473.1 adenylosuccinate lyase [Spirochaetota bacterium]HPA63315.1 adenylosuccinate lyase [Spirochaetota bacterium]HPJ14633.1 adenylosuccinate lyase [Spirochaetota bacterium]HPW50720.1 adenylosuccinate lyase [Spirochaetota bacterium]